MKEGKLLILLIAAVIVMHAYSKKNKDGVNRLEFLKSKAPAGLAPDTSSTQVNPSVLSGHTPRHSDSSTTAKLNSFH